MKKFLILIITMLSLIVITPKNKVYAYEDEDILSTYTQDFSNLNEVNTDFKAFYLFTMGGKAEQIEISDNKDANTKLYINNNSVIRQSIGDDISTNYQTESFTIMTLTKRRYLNFELTIDYKMGTSTMYWPVVGFRQNEQGKYFLEDGVGAFLQRQGYITIWGRGFNPLESSPVSNYSANDWHTMKLVVVSNTASIYIDNSSEVNYKKWLPGDTFTNGFISLISVNNDSEFRNLTIKELPLEDDSNKISQNPIPDSTSHESILNQAKKVDKIIEVEKVEVSEEIIDTDYNILDLLGPLLSSILGVSIISLFLIKFVFLRKK